MAGDRREGETGAVAEPGETLLSLGCNAIAEDRREGETGAGALAEPGETSLSLGCNAGAQIRGGMQEAMREETALAS